MSPSSTTKYQGETKSPPPVKVVGGGKRITDYQALSLINSHDMSSVLGKVRNPIITISQFTMHLNSVTLVQ